MTGQIVIVHILNITVYIVTFHVLLALFLKLQVPFPALLW